MFEDFTKTNIKGLLAKELISFVDFRGEIVKLNQNSTFKEQNITISTRFVLRGFHYVTEGRRILTPIYGRAYIVFADMRDGDSKYFWVSQTVDNNNRYSFLIPPYVACAYLVLSDLLMVHYDWEKIYDKSLQRTVRFDDEWLNVYWPGNTANYIISERDYYADESFIR